jgi:hypothetical protein
MWLKKLLLKRTPYNNTFLKGIAKVRKNKLLLITLQLNMISNSH